MHNFQQVLHLFLHFGVTFLFLGVLLERGCQEILFYLLFLSNENSTPRSASPLFVDKSWHMFFSSNLSEQMFSGGILCSALNEL